MSRADPVVDERVQIELDGISYPVDLRRSARAKSVILSVDAVAGSIRLTMPRHVSENRALAFARSRRDWLRGCIADAPEPVPIENGAQLALHGESHKICWSPDYFRKPERVAGEIRLGGPEDKVQERVIAWLKTEARRAYADDLAHYCDRAGENVPKLSIGDARRRWGSCSGKRAIRLNWRLVMAPPMIRRSVVAHEVAHLRHMNHSAAFYALLDSIFEGDRKAADRWLKQHGRGIVITCPGCLFRILPDPNHCLITNGFGDTCKSSIHIIIRLIVFSIVVGYVGR